MANETLTFWFVLFTSFLFCQTPGVYVSRVNASKVEIYNDCTIKFDFLNLGKNDSIIGSYIIKKNKMIINYSLYNHFINQVNCQGEDYGILIEDNLGCFTKGTIINESCFFTNYISFKLDDFKSNNDTLNFNISNNCIEIQFDEHFELNKKGCYILTVQFNLTPFDVPRFSEVYIKNSKSLIIDGIKYRYIKN